MCTLLRAGIRRGGPFTQWRDAAATRCTTFAGVHAARRPRYAVTALLLYLRPRGRSYGAATSLLCGGTALQHRVRPRGCAHAPPRCSPLSVLQHVRGYLFALRVASAAACHRRIAVPLGTAARR
jgi:hypothetical protein